MANGTLSMRASVWASSVLPQPVGPMQQDVRLRQLDVVVVGGAELHPLVVVVDRDRQDLLRLLLADDVVVQELVDLTGLGQLVEAELGGLGELLLDDLVAEIDALVADVDAGPGDELLDLLLRLAAERALQQLATVSELGHVVVPPLRVVACASAGTAVIGPLVSASSRVEITSSMMPYSLASSADITKSRSVSRWIFSTVWPVWWARISSRRTRMRRISLAASSMSVAWPWARP